MAAKNMPTQKPCFFKTFEWGALPVLRLICHVPTTRAHWKKFADRKKQLQLLEQQEAARSIETNGSTRACQEMISAVRSMEWNQLAECNGLNKESIFITYGKDDIYEKSIRIIHGSISTFYFGGLQE